MDKWLGLGLEAYMLKPAAESDLPAAVAVINASYRGESSRQGWTHEADYFAQDRTSLDQLKADLQDSPQATLYLWRDTAEGSLLGTVWLEAHERGIWYLGLLAVRPDLQARRLGRTILAAAEDVARAAGGVRVRMTVINLRETLIEWYRRRGYVPTGQTQPFPTSDPPLSDLHFFVMEKAL